MTGAKTVTFDTPRTSSQSDRTGYNPKLSYKGPAKICYPTGSKWDFLRPTTKPYQGFGGMSAFNEKTADERTVGTEESWHHTIHITPYGQRRPSSKASSTSSKSSS